MDRKTKFRKMLVDCRFLIEAIEMTLDVKAVLVRAAKSSDSRYIFCFGGAIYVAGTIPGTSDLITDGFPVLGDDVSPEVKAVAAEYADLIRELDVLPPRVKLSLLKR